ncbi:MAG: hypothetical protein HC796_06825, partial [Synechococcaceae cyanobacterium RL_1_2]|nr:hypothetical protein [Synechococcaceae cyanobacterium RL_1_2]
MTDDSTDQIPHIYGLQFHWDDATLNQMEPSLSLEISQDLRVVLRYYLLLEADMPLYCGLNFISTYNGVRVIGSEICLNGQITNQVRQDFLEQTELLDKITNGHHLLMQEMLSELSLVNYRQGINDFISNIAWISALVIVGISVALNFHRFYDNLVLVLLSIVAVPLVCFFCAMGDWDWFKKSIPV